LNCIADHLDAIAVTQIFICMVQNGLRFNCIGMAPTEVYLRITKDDLTPLSECLTEPMMGVAEATEFGFDFLSW
jgi:hypothetical protein